MTLVTMLPKPVRRAAKQLMVRSGMVFPTPGANIHSCLERRRGDVRVGTVIDVGASTGVWSAEVMKYFSSAQYLLVEAHERYHGAGLRKFKAEHANVDFEICAAGDQDGEAFFHESDDPYAGAASHSAFSNGNMRVKMRTMDSLVRERNLRGPYLLKLDTHGFEVPIFEGAARVLSQASMLIIEAYNFTICPGALRFYELCAYLEPKGFRCADMFDLMIRPANDALWQMDMVFLPASHAIFNSSAYQPEPAPPKA